MSRACDPRDRSLRAAVAGAVMALLGAWAAPAHADAPEGHLRVELNKLEPRDDGCRLYLLLDNRESKGDFASMRLDLIFFGKDGVIAKRLAVDAGPIRPTKTSVKMFDLAGLTCDGMSQVLINDALDCKDPAGAERKDCTDMLTPTSRVPTVALIK